jgi:hypothetical protein
MCAMIEKFLILLWSMRQPRSDDRRSNGSNARSSRTRSALHVPR